MAGLLWYRSYMDSLANTSGYYPDIHAGHADRVTELTLDAPYLVRETPAGYNQLELMELVGGGVAWNQLCNSSSVTGTSGHKFYLKKSGVESITNTNTFTGLTSGTDMVTDLTQMFGPTIADYVYSLEQSTAGSGIAWLKKYDLIDDAYHAYSAPTLQSVEATSHVTVGRNQFDISQFATDYPALCSMSDGVLSVSAGGVLYTTGCVVDIPCDTAGGGYLTSEMKCGTAANVRFRIVYDDGTYYESSGVSATSWTKIEFPLLAKKVVAIRFNWSNPLTFFVRNLCISLGITDRDGEYTPYTKHTTPLANVTLRGMLKTDADGNLYYDGDTYEWDGTVTRKYGYRAYQNGDVSDGSTMITDGSHTVYKLTTPTTESADPYTAVQTVEDGGTEEFVTTNGVPVGNVSVYRRA